MSKKLLSIIILITLVLFLSANTYAQKAEKKWGYIDKTGKMVIKPQFDWTNSFSERLASVWINKKYGYIDTAGKIVIEPQFDFVGFFSEGLAPVKILERLP